MKKFDLVVGSCYGDCGKGTITARLAATSTGKIANVLTNGGPQRGHSVCFNNVVHVFHHFGSATPWDATTFYDRNFILNPMAFRQEYEEIYKKFHIILPNAVRDTMCRWTTPFDMMFNQMESQFNWKGTCGMGIWATICRFKEIENPTFDCFCQEFTYEQKVQYLNKVKQYYKEKWSREIPSNYMIAWYSKYLIEHFIDDCIFMYEHTEKLTSKIIDKFDHVIFENGQGLMLNDDGTDDSEKTPSQTGSNTISNFLNLVPDFEHLNIHYVTRPYLTRHGSNKFKPENVDGDLKKDDEINKYNDWQRSFLYANLDLNMLKSTIDKDRSRWFGKDNISFIVDVTHCDELDRTKEFKAMFPDWKLNFHDKKDV